VISAIGKSAVAGRVAVRGVNLAGDEQADRHVHGGPDKAIYAYASEDTAWWATVLGSELGAGAFGENLTTIGVDVSGAVIGERWQIGSSELEVCQPRQPCYKLGIAFGDPGMLRRFAHAGRPGAYLRIVQEGELGAGDEVEIVRRPAPTTGSRSRPWQGQSSPMTAPWRSLPPPPRCRHPWLPGCASGPALLAAACDQTRGPFLQREPPSTFS
jgi:MOSC domain-containing protein YiiM